MRKNQKKLLLLKNQKYLAAISIIALLAFSVGIFLIEDLRVLVALSGGLIFITLIFNLKKERLQKCLKMFRRNLVFMIFIWICNLLFADFETAIKVSVRLFLMILVVLDFSKILTPRNFAEGIGVLMRPFKVFKVDAEGSVLAIMVSLNLVPVLAREASHIKRALELKGVDKKISSFFKCPLVYVQCYFSSLIRRIREMERALILKGF